MPLPIVSLADQVVPAVRIHLENAHESDSLIESIAHAERALEQAEESGDDRSVAIARRSLMFPLYRNGQKAQVCALTKATSDALVACGLENYSIEVLRWGGLCAVDIGRMEDAISWASESYEISERLDDHHGRILGYSLLGGAFDRLGDPWHGEMLLRKGLAVAREFGQRYPLMVSLNNLCAVMIGKYYMLRDGAGGIEAKQFLVEAEPIAREVAELAVAMNDPFYEAFTEGNLGEVLVHLGKVDDAKTRLDRSVHLAQTHKLAAVSSRVRCSYAELALRKENYPETLRLVAESRDDAITTSSPSTMLRVEYAAYIAHRRLGEFREALLALESLRKIESERSTQQLHARSQVMLTRLEAQESERRGLARAIAVASAHAARATALERAAFEDELTGIANRRAFEREFPLALQRASTNAGVCSLAMFDIDQFKQINDVAGHAAGDSVLQRVAHLLQQSLGEHAFVARIGGEEFVAFVEGKSAADWYSQLERIRLEVSTYPWQEISAGLQVTVSIGVATVPPYSAEQLLERADFAMYRAKRTGRNRVAIAG